MGKKSDQSDCAGEVTLSAPIEAHGEELYSLRFRKPKGRDFKQISASSMESPFQMILDFAAVLADVPPSAMDELEAADVQRVCEVVGPLLPQSHGTGAN